MIEFSESSSREVVVSGGFISEAVFDVREENERCTHNACQRDIIEGSEEEHGVRRVRGIHREVGSGVFSQGQGEGDTRTREGRDRSPVSWLPQSPIWVSRAGCSGRGRSRQTSTNSSTRRGSWIHLSGLRILEGP